MSRAVIHHDGAIDKFVGDELVAFFYPALAGERHVAAAIGAAQELLRETGHADPGEPGRRSAPASTRARSGSAPSARESMWS